MRSSGIKSSHSNFLKESSCRSNLNSPTNGANLPPKSIISPTRLAHSRLLNVSGIRPLLFPTFFRALFLQNSAHFCSNLVNRTLETILFQQQSRIYHHYLGDLVDLIHFNRKPLVLSTICKQSVTSLREFWPLRQSPTYVSF